MLYQTHLRPCAMPILFLLLLTLSATLHAAPPVTIDPVNDRDATVLVATNSGHAPVHIQLTFTQLLYAHLSKSPPHRFVVPPRQTMDLITIRPTSKSIPPLWSYRYTSTWGDPGTVHFPGSRYLLPFEPGTPFSVSQAFDRPTTHNRQSNRNAIDFSVAQGTPIVAARAGMVIERVLSNTTASTNVDHIKKANYILIAHEDGSIATYAHLHPHISYVHVGQKVSAGQRIALSGNTGYSGGPHLHFNVTVTRLKESASVPVTFVDSVSRRVLPWLRTGYRGTVSGPAGWQPVPNPTVATSKPSPQTTTTAPFSQSDSTPPQHLTHLSNAQNPRAFTPLAPATSSLSPSHEPYKLMSLGEIASRTLADVGNIVLRAYHYYTTGKASPGLNSSKAEATRHIALAMPAVLSAALLFITGTILRRLILHAQRANWGTAGFLALLIFGASYIALNLYSKHTLQNESPLVLLSNFTQYAAYDPGGTLLLVALVCAASWGLLRIAAPQDRLAYLSWRSSSRPSYAEPTLSTAPAQPASSPKEPSAPHNPYGDLAALQKALKADPNAAHRLLEYELLSDPSITHEEAARRAYRRFSA